jgi:membrane protein implicated in regulation of membrane protease activity
MKNEVRFFKVFLMWLGFIAIGTMFGEYIVSREVNGYLQLLSFVGVVGILIYVINETRKLLTKKQRKND